MKKISTFFLLFFLSFSSSLSFADERHDAIINQYIEMHPQVQGTFFTLDELINTTENLNNAHLVLTGQELKNKQCFNMNLYRKLLNIHIILDVHEGDGLVKDASLLLDSLLPWHITRLTIVNIAQDVKRLEDNFLHKSRLIYLDFSSLRQVTQIGNNFLSYCDELTQLDLSPFNQVTHIGNGFLGYCSGLTQLDLSPLNQVTQIEALFLTGCSRLTYLDLSPLSQVTQIGDSFLCACQGLIELDLSPLSQTTQIGTYYFLSYCSGLTQLDLSPLNQMTQIEDHFLDSCSGLTYLDLSSLSQVTQIGDRFLRDCNSLTRFDQIILPTYNATLKESLKAAFLPGTTIRDMIQDVYVEEFAPRRTSTKNARNVDL